MKILVLGGCHTYAFGLENLEQGFLSLINYDFEKSDLSNFNSELHAPISLSGALRFFKSEEITKELYSYDIILFQLGNFEFNASLTDFYKLFLIDSSQKNDINKVSSFRKLSQQQILDRRAWYNKKKDYSGISKLFKNIVSKCLGSFIRGIAQIYPIAKLKREETRAFELLDLLVPYKQKTIFLGPFPTADDLSNEIRKLGSYAIESYAKKNEIEFVNFVDFEFDESYFLNDLVHLNEKGHLRIYSILKEALMKNKHLKSFL